MKKISIRRAKEGDEKIIAYIQTEAWKAAFVDIISNDEMLKYTNVDVATKVYKNVLSRSMDNGYILEVEDKPSCIAFWGKCRYEKYADAAEIICIHCLPDCWKKGYGSMMIEHILSEMNTEGYNEVILWVFEENVRACKFYEKHGFIATDDHQKIYSAVEVMYRKIF